MKRKCEQKYLENVKKKYREMSPEMLRDITLRSMTEEERKELFI